MYIYSKRITYFPRVTLTWKCISKIYYRATNKPNIDTLYIKNNKQTDDKMELFNSITIASIQRSDPTH